MNEWKDLIWNELCNFEESRDSYFVKRDRLQEVIDQQKEASSGGGGSSSNSHSGMNNPESGQTVAMNTEGSSMMDGQEPFHNDESPLQGELNSRNI